MTNNIVPFVFEDNTIRSDEMVNATALTKAYKAATGIRKDSTKWLATKEAKESIAYLESVTQKCVLLVNHGGSDPGTWMHPDLAEVFAQWISVEYRFAVVKLIRDNKNRTPQKLPGSFAEALRLAADQQELLERQKIEIRLLEEDNERQAEAIDELFDYSSIIRIAKYNGCAEKAFKWRILRAAAKATNTEIKKVPCPRFGEKNLYSHDAWRLAYPGYRLPETTTLVINRET